MYEVASIKYQVLSIKYQVKRQRQMVYVVIPEVDIKKFRN